MTMICSKLYNDTTSDKKKENSKTDLIHTAEKSRPANIGNIEGTMTSFATTKPKLNK